MKSMKIGTTNNVLAIAGITIIAAVSLYVAVVRKGGKQQKQQLNGGDNDVVLEGQFQKAAEMAKSLTNMTNGDRLMLYGLYKQAMEGDRNIEEPSTLKVVAHAKYTAWGKFQGMSQSIARMKYCEVIDHFSTGGKSIFAPDDDNADIIYPDEDDDEDEEDDGSNHKVMSGFGMTQSTMMGAPTDIQSKDNIMSIHECANEGNVSQLKTLIQEQKINNVNIPDESGQTALHFAADRGHFDCVSTLIQFGADVNASDIDGISVLQSAVIGGQVDIARLLLQSGANPDQTDNDGDTPRNSIETDDDEMIQLFKQY